MLPQSLNLNPFDESQYFLVFKGNNHAQWSLPSSWAPDIKEVATQYQRTHALSSGTTDDVRSPDRNTDKGALPTLHRRRRLRHHRTNGGLDMGDVLITVGKVAELAGAVATIAGTGCTVM